MFLLPFLKISFLFRNNFSFTEKTNCVNSTGVGVINIPRPVHPIVNLSRYHGTCVKTRKFGIGTVLVSKLQTLCEFHQFFHECPLSETWSNMGHRVTLSCHVSSWSLLGCDSSSVFPCFSRAWQSQEVLVRYPRPWPLLWAWLMLLSCLDWAYRFMERILQRWIALLITSHSVTPDITGEVLLHHSVEEVSARCLCWKVTIFSFPRSILWKQS